MHAATQNTSQGWFDKVREFFYAERVPYGLALIRIVLPWVIFIDGLPRAFQVRELYSSDGAPAPLWEGYGLTEGFPFVPAPVAVAGYWALMFFLLAVSLGWMTRFSLIAATVLYMYFTPLDMISTMNKYTVLSGHALFLLSLSPCGSLWSVDAWIRRQRDPLTPSRPRFPIWPQRLIQLLIGIVYLAAAVTKLHTPVFFSGEHLVFWMLTETTASNPIGDWMSMYPAVAPLTAYATVIWEVIFIFVAWRGIGRITMLGFGVVFHALTYGMLGLIVFPLLYCVLYLAWLHEEDVQRISRWWSQRTGRVASHVAEAVSTAPVNGRWSGWFAPAPNVAMFGVLTAVTMLASVEIERRSDVFGERRAEGKPALQFVPEARVAELLRQDERLRPQDKVFSFDVGSQVIGGILANHRDVFGYDEDVVVQCSLTPPHEDMWVEFNLHDARGRLITRQGQFAARENLRVTHTHRFGEGLPAGEYVWVLRFDGHDIAERRFHLGRAAVQPASVAAAAIVE